MISCNEFVDIMTRLKSLDDKQRDVNDALANLCGSNEFGSFYLGDYLEIIIRLLEREFNDSKYGWIRYFVYEKNWLSELKPSDIIIDSDTEVPISNWEEAYYFILSQEKVNTDCNSYYYDKYYSSGRCLGTKEQDFCSCDGNKLKCTWRNK